MGGFQCCWLPPPHRVICVTLWLRPLKNKWWGTMSSGWLGSSLYTGSCKYFDLCFADLEQDYICTFAWTPETHSTTPKHAENIFKSLSHIIELHLIGNAGCVCPQCVSVLLYSGLEERTVIGWSTNRALPQPINCQERCFFFLSKALQNIWSDAEVNRQRRNRRNAAERWEKRRK